jgi:hypothetical protein
VNAAPGRLLIFSRAYPNTDLVVTSPDAHPAFARDYAGASVRFMTLDRLVAELNGEARPAQA